MFLCICVVALPSKIIACFLDVKELGLCAKREEMSMPGKVEVGGGRGGRQSWTNDYESVSENWHQQNLEVLTFRYGQPDSKAPLYQVQNIDQFFPSNM